MMKLSAKTEYACKSVLELALHWPCKTPLPINTISQNQQIPMNFLTQILVGLKNAGLVQSVRGKAGGYLLEKSPDKISLADVVFVFESSFSNKEEGHVLHDVLAEISEQTEKALADVSFEELANRVKTHENVVMFNI